MTNSCFQPWEMPILWRLCEAGAQVDESQSLLLQQKQAYHPEFQVYTFLRKGHLHYEFAESE